MSSKIEILGINGLLKAIKEKTKKYNKGMRNGVTRAGLFLQRESQKIVPIDQGNLKSSARTDYFRTLSGGHDATVSYTAAYAIFVHEDLEARHNEGQVAKFLERPYRENQNRLRDIIKEEVKRAS